MTSSSFPPPKGATTEEQRAARLRAKAAANVPRETSSVPAAAKALPDAVHNEVTTAIFKFRRWARI